MKKSLIICVVLGAVVIITFIGYNIYRHPTTFRNLSDKSLDEAQVNSLREKIRAKTDKKILVAYFSYSGTTKSVATALGEKTGADLFEITTKKAYSNLYLESNSQIRKNERPALADTVENMAKYDIIFVGFPVWWHATPAPVNTFLDSYDLKGKLIIPFCTSGGSNIKEPLPTFLNSCGGLAVYGGKLISETSQLDAWVTELDL